MGERSDMDPGWLTGRLLTDGLTTILKVNTSREKWTYHRRSEHVCRTVTLFNQFCKKIHAGLESSEPGSES